ncbi:hypothetical protein STAQ_33870 [Allostella sp. ATCC 35155]|nr:hypothetical protein STAQ_33870 [Stella sp. ATCC 35155]
MTKRARRLRGCRAIGPAAALVLAVAQPAGATDRLDWADGDRAEWVLASPVAPGPYLQLAQTIPGYDGEIPDKPTGAPGIPPRRPVPPPSNPIPTPDVPPPPATWAWRSRTAAVAGRSSTG